MDGIVNKKILIIINNLGVGGAERLVVDEINELMRRGFSLCLLTLKKESVFSLSGDCHLGKEYWSVIDFGSLFNITSWVKVFRFFSQEKIDVLITHLWFSNTIGRVAGKICGIKKIISFEHNIYDTLKTRKCFLIDWLLQIFSTNIIAVSGAVKNSLVRHFISKNKIRVILNGIDLSKYKNINNEVSKNKEDFTFIFIGRLIHQKAVDILLRGFSLVERGNLLIVGDGAEKKNLMKLSKELKIDDRVNFLGIVKNVPEVLSQADCFVLPSRYEGFGMVIVEAMAAGLPVILSDFEVSKDLITDGQEGYIVSTENPQILAERMNYLYDNLDIRKKMSVASLKKSLVFSIENHVDQLIKYT